MTDRPDPPRMSSLPIPVERALRKLGRDMGDARRRRRIPMKLLAERADISRSTLAAIERGRPGVAFGSYAVVLYILGMLERVAELADVRRDDTGIMLEEERLPLRVRQPSRWNGEPRR